LTLNISHPQTRPDSGCVCQSYLVPSDFADELPKGFFKIVEAELDWLSLML
jgi:hypothetical protein